MGPYYYWLSSDARFQDIQRSHNEARVAALAEGIDQLRDVAAGIWAAGTAPLRAVGRWYRRAATVRQLNALDDRMLHDIGLSRAAIRDAAQAPERFAPRLDTAPQVADVHVLVPRQDPQLPAAANARQGVRSHGRSAA